MPGRQDDPIWGSLPSGNFLSRNLDALSALYKKVGSASSSLEILSPETFHLQRKRTISPTRLREVTQNVPIFIGPHVQIGYTS